MDDPLKPSAAKLTQNALLEQRERAAADLVKVLAQVKEELARARELLARIGREQSSDQYRPGRRALLPPRLDKNPGSSLFNRGEEG